MALFDDVTDKYHKCGVDNMYMSAIFFRDAYNHSKKIKLHNVTCKSRRSLPASIIQEELHNKKEQEKVRGIVVAAELVGDSTCPSLIAISI